MARVIIQRGGVAGGYMDCDGKRHRWVYAEWKAYGLREVTPMGQCLNPEACKQQAAALEKQQQDEAEKAARAALNANDPKVKKT